MRAEPDGMIAATLQRFDRVRSRVRNHLDGRRIRSALRDEPIPLPPARLIRLVAGTDDLAWFLGSGQAAATCLVETLAAQGRRIDQFRSVLDFGCGVGRVLRHWSGVEGPEFHGSDYNPALVRWCRENLPFARITVNDLDGRLASGDGAHDLIYALSVFTHLTEAGHRAWMAELRRVLPPGGLLFFTTHGTAYLPQLTPEEQARFGRGDLVVRGDGRAGSNHCAAFHPERYVREAMAGGFEILSFEPRGARGNPVQDAWLLRKR